jgi:3-deoxy-manno-octulosonate cytidylyltransferase (CMP-KDO synthetase)
MKVLGVVPARYASSRLPGKPIVDICGKPMIWWVYQQAIKVSEFDEVIVATDDTRIMDVCKSLSMKAIMTSPDGPCLIDRLYEVSNIMSYDYYVSINGDEPLIESEIIANVLPSSVNNTDIVYRGLMRVFTDPVEVVDPGNMKIVCNSEGRLIYVSRSPVPYPGKSAQFTFKKYIGVECFNKPALDFYMKTPPGEIEIIEDLGTLRFLENGIYIHYTMVESSSLSVDTPRDLDKVREIMQGRITRGEISG